MNNDAAVSPTNPDADAPANPPEPAKDRFYLGEDGLIRRYCDSCGFRIKAPLGVAGRTGQCPRCGQPAHMPTRTDLGLREPDPPQGEADSDDPPSAESMVELAEPPAQTTTTTDDPVTTDIDAPSDDTNDTDDTEDATTPPVESDQFPPREESAAQTDAATADVAEPDATESQAEHADTPGTDEEAASEASSSTTTPAAEPRDFFLGDDGKIRRYCPECGFRVKVSLNMAGRRGGCPSCQTKVQMPTRQELGLPPLKEKHDTPPASDAQPHTAANASTAHGNGHTAHPAPTADTPRNFVGHDGLMRTHCPDCDFRIKAPLKMVGRWGNCPSCGSDVMMPMVSALKMFDGSPVPPEMLMQSVSRGDAPPRDSDAKVGLDDDGQLHQRCLGCGGDIVTEPKMAGRAVDCPTCGEENFMPLLPEKATKSAEQPDLDDFSGGLPEGTSNTAIAAPADPGDSGQMQALISEADQWIQTGSHVEVPKAPPPPLKERIKVAVGLTAAVLLIGGVVGLILLDRMGAIGRAATKIGKLTKRPDLKYYYDEATGELFTVRTRAVPPFDPNAPDDQPNPANTESDETDSQGGESQDSQTAVPDSATAVRAYVFACGSCAEEDARFIGWLEKYHNQAKLQLEQQQAAIDKGEMPPRFDPSPKLGRLVRNPEAGSEWVSIRKRASADVMSVRERCADPEKPLVECQPAP